MDLYPGATIDVEGASVIVHQAYMGGHCGLILGEDQATQRDPIVSVPVEDNGEEEGDALRVWLGTPERTGIAPGVRSIREEYIRMVTEAIREEMGPLEVEERPSSDPADY